ncbi:expressed unknown protein [Seminavis robusta]|uniref:Uncharacterized protein n=1 Tax=Seminavis robusta TaxID=568900 RepID=A0A9N8DFA1_9STRA|nr:expressed unknown protein [Seminavis robusta]|eukprot:Sro129_g061630.1 n/a (265) ;mRNA; r:77065-78142
MVYWWMLGAEPTAEEPEGVIVKNRRSLQGTHCTGTDCCTTYISGDLHLNTWKGESFDCHGEVIEPAGTTDRVLEVRLGHGEGSIVGHNRSRSHYDDFSFISSAAMQVGQDILEVSGWGNYLFNGVNGAGTLGLGGNSVPNLQNGGPITYKMVNEKQHVFDIKLGEAVYLDWISVTLNGGPFDNMGDSVFLCKGPARVHSVSARDHPLITGKSPEPLHACSGTRHNNCRRRQEDNPFSGFGRVAILSLVYSREKVKCDIEGFFSM